MAASLEDNLPKGFFFLSTQHSEIILIKHGNVLIETR